jgi:hypothetical protein
MTQQRC